MTTPTALAIAGAVGVALYFVHRGVTSTALPVTAPSPLPSKSISAGGWQTPNNPTKSFVPNATGINATLPKSLQTNGTLPRGFVL